MSRVQGYTPEILVLGRSRHFPACNSNENTGSSEWIGVGDEEQTGLESTEFLENLARRETARKAFVSADHEQKLRRALLRQSRPKREAFAKGQWVMFWRHGKAGQPSQWIGPGKVIVSEEPNVVWVTYFSRLFRCAPEHLRSVSERECQSSSIENQSEALPDQLGTGVFQYTDLTGPQVVQVPVDNQTMMIPETAVPPQVAPVPSGTSETSEDQPDAEPLQENPPPADIPIPDEPFSEDSGEDSALHQWEDFRDHWQIRDDKVFRIHREPRYRMFCPTNVVDCPIPTDWLLPERETQGRFHGTHDWHTDDVWLNNPQGHQSLPTHWVGETIFHVRPEFQDQLPKTPMRKPTSYSGISFDIDFPKNDFHWFEHCPAA